MNRKQLIIFICFLSLGVYPIYYYATDGYKEVNCGVIHEMKEPYEFEMHKHNADVELHRYFIIKRSNNTYFSVEPTLTDFYTCKKGDKVCYLLPSNTFWSGLLCVFAIVYVFIYFISLIIWIIIKLEE